MQLDGILKSLGIPPDYGNDPLLPRYDDAGELEEVEENFAGRMQSLTPATANSWRSMKQAALSDGVEIYLVSGYRSIAYQTELFQKKLASGRPIDSILKVNAAPGFSQHHTGMAVDITTPGTEPLQEEFEKSEAFGWLQVNAGRFDFNMPFCRGNNFGFVYEPWHWSQIK